MERRRSELEDRTFGLAAKLDANVRVASEEIAGLEERRSGRMLRAARRVTSASAAALGAALRRRPAPPRSGQRCAWERCDVGHEPPEGDAGAGEPLALRADLLFWRVRSRPQDPGSMAGAHAHPDADLVQGYLRMAWRARRWTVANPPSHA
ncbi:hypothetical protein WME89_26365 [Sorangium sp. So ce321]|uniref:hypothetical protein n=1 Tax=Sorangium sp. So ce321 TaxID=3133300 RepID=UPI003F646F29